MTRSTRSSAVAPPASDGEVVADFIEAACIITKGADAGKNIELRGWQRELLRDLFVLRADGRRRFRQALIGLPRKNGKSALGSGIALYGMFDEPGAEVYSCAGDKKQAGIVFDEAKKSVQQNPMLSDRFKVFKDAIEYPSLGSVYRVLSAEAFSKEGLNPSLVVFDELHVQPNRELWDVMNLGSGTRTQPLVLAITTAGVKTDSTGGDSVCFDLWRYGKRVLSGEIDDPSFFFRWWGAPDEADYKDRDVWTAANPALGDYLHLEDFEATVRRTPENEFRTKRLNQWVSSLQAWLPQGSWAQCETKGPVPAGADVILGFDGSFDNDSTALVVCSVGETPHLDVVAAWERGLAHRADWQVPIVDVEAEIREACRRWQVREIVCDPFRWARTYQILESEGLPVVEFPQSPARMTPATQRFYEAVVNRTVTHSGDPRLARHLENCRLKVDARGSRVAKETKTSPLKIDLAIAAVMAHDRACQPAPLPGPAPFASWG